MLMYSLCLLCSFSELLLTVISCNACALCHWVSIKATYLLDTMMCAAELLLCTIDVVARRVLFIVDY